MSVAKDELLAQTPTPRLEVMAPVDVGGIAFPICYLTRPVVFIDPFAVGNVKDCVTGKWRNTRLNIGPSYL